MMSLFKYLRGLFGVVEERDVVIVPSEKWLETHALVDSLRFELAQTRRELDHARREVLTFSTFESKYLELKTEYEKLKAKVAFGGARGDA
jgi:hypothetical protein